MSKRSNNDEQDSKKSRSTSSTTVPVLTDEELLKQHRETAARVLEIGRRVSANVEADRSRRLQGLPQEPISQADQDFFKNVADEAEANRLRSDEIYRRNNPNQPLTRAQRQLQQNNSPQVRPPPAPISDSEREFLEFGERHVAAIAEERRKRFQAIEEERQRNPPPPVDPNERVHDHMGFLSVSLTYAIWGYALSRDSDDPYAGDLFNILSKMDDDESPPPREDFETGPFSTAFMKIVNGVKSGQVTDNLCIKALEYATYDSKGFPEITTRAGAEAMQHYGEQFQERYANGLRKLDGDESDSE